jgi:hypothetical protein
MAGTLVITTLSDGTNSTSATNCIQGSARAWVNFNGSGGATINGSFNISSVTRTGGGQYYISFSTAMVNINYALVGSASVSTGNFGLLPGDEVASRTTLRSGNFYTVNTASVNAAADANNISVVVFSS